MPMTIPNLLTLLRLGLIPVFVLIYYLPFGWSHITSAIIFIVAALTDWLDGFLARAWRQTSSLGEFLDPVADKLIVAVALVLLVSDRTLPLLAIPAAIIVGREIVISALREWMAEMGKRASVAVSYVGKVKTFIQMLAIVLLLLHKSVATHFYTISGYVCLYLAAILTLWSMMMYLKAAWPDLIVDKKP